KHQVSSLLMGTIEGPVRDTRNGRRRFPGHLRSVFTSITSPLFSRNRSNPVLPTGKRAHSRLPRLLRPESCLSSSRLTPHSSRFLPRTSNLAPRLTVMFSYPSAFQSL